MSHADLVRLCAKGMLRLVTFVMPAFIAACYGPPHDESVDANRCKGKVIDRDTKNPISGIEVRCIVKDSSYDADYTGTDGGYYTNAPETGCDTLVAEDVDGATNGSYGSVTVPVSSSTGCDVDIELAKK